MTNTRVAWRHTVRSQRSCDALCKLSIAPSFTEVWPTAAIELSGVADTAQREDCTIAHRIVKMAAVIEKAGLRLKPLFEGKNLAAANS